MDESKVDELIAHYRAAISHAQRVNTATLEQLYIGWGKHFQEEFIQGLHLVIEGHNEANATKAVRGQELLQSWGKWFNENLHDMRQVQ